MQGSAPLVDLFSDAGPPACMQTQKHASIQLLQLTLWNILASSKEQPQT